MAGHIQGVTGFYKWEDEARNLDSEIMIRIMNNYGAPKIMTTLRNFVTVILVIIADFCDVFALSQTAGRQKCEVAVLQHAFTGHLQLGSPFRATYKWQVMNFHN